MKEAAEGGTLHNPLHQFMIKPLVNLELFSWDVSFTNSSLFMVLTVVLIGGTLYLGVHPKRLVPTPVQAFLEWIYDFIKDLAVTTIGPEGTPYISHLVTLFLFLAVGNLLGMLPYGFTFTSHLIVTSALAVLVIVAVTLLGIYKQGFQFFQLFFPKGVPLFLVPLLLPIEVLSYLSRPVTLAIRLFANMVAGHAMLKIFSGFVVLLSSWLFLPVAVLSFLTVIFLTIFEIFVALFQAYIFVLLTCIYLKDAIKSH